VRQLIERCGTIPLCSVGLELSGYPSVTLDNHRGMELVVEHLIEHHGCRRPAFIAGTPNNPEARVRLAVYQQVLERHGIEPDPKLVATGNFVSSGGYSAMQEIIARGVPIDAVIAANDTMAFAAMSALREHGYRVPRDVAVTGFDDIPLARFGNPPLTTVAQPFGRMTERALELVLEQMRGAAVPEVNGLPAELMLRQSCGCGVSTRRRESQAPSRGETGPAAFLRQRAEPLHRMLVTCLEPSALAPARDASSLLQALARELTSEPGSFLHALDDLIDHKSADLALCRSLEQAVLSLRNEFRRFATPEIEDLWHDARDALGQACTRVEFLQQLQLDRNYQRMSAMSARLALSIDLASVTRALEETLPSIGVQTAFYSRCAADSPKELEPFLCLIDGQPQAPREQRFPEQQLFPSGLLPANQRTTWLVFPLCFETRRLGVAVFDYAPHTHGYQLLRDQIGAALHSVGLYQEVREKTLLHERSVQERLATAQRLTSLSVLAGGVAHDLNNSLGPLVALPDVILAELANSEPTAEARTDLRLDVESIKLAALRASQTIKDLLTLGRQGRTTKEPVDLNALVQACLDEESLRSEPKAHVSIRAELSPTPLVIHASEAHIVRAVTNLVRNAVEAIDGPGLVIVRTHSTELVEPTSGYETIVPGDYAVVSVSDTGAGIPPAELFRVFEPFFSKKRVGNSSGSGLGLAIVHGVVKEHEGFIDVTSALGSGTTFSLYFPRADDEAISTRAMPVFARGHARILIVDDEPIQLHTGRRVLTHLGYEVDILRSGQQARELLARTAATGARPYDLVILDMILNEDRDGLDLFEEIRHFFPNQNAIVASGYAPTERAERAISQGLAWLMKPYTREALLGAVEAALECRPTQTVVGVPATQRPPRRP
jgi:signal transduction histidine kinase/ActR/RegA family two-component response regulator